MGSQSVVELVDAHGNKITNKPVVVNDIAKGTLRAITHEDGSLLDTREVARSYGLALNNLGQPRSQTVQGSQLNWDYNEKTGELMLSALIPDTIDTTYDYLKDLDELSEAKLDRGKELELARLLFDNEPICARTLEALIENAITGGHVSIVNAEARLKGEKLEKRDPQEIEAQMLCESWIKHVNNFSAITDTAKAPKLGIVGQIGGLDGILRHGALCYWRDGDWVATQKWESVKLSEMSGTSYNLPTRITTHDVSSLRFSKAGAALGFDIIEWNPPSEIKEAAKNPGNDEAKKVIKEALSDWMQKLLKDPKTDRIPLPPYRTTHVKRWGEDWKEKGRSYLRPFMHVLADKGRLRRLDRATIIGLIQQFTIMMLGSDDPESEYHIVDPKRFRLFKKSIENLKTMHLMAWAGTDIKKEVLSPPAEILDFKSKYGEVDDDLKIATGMTQLLINGVSSGNAQRDWASFVGVMSKLETFRSAMRHWVGAMLYAIMIENKMEKFIPIYEFQPLKMRDERDLWMTRIQALAGGVQGRRDTLLDLGKNPDAVLDNQLEEAEQDLNEKLLPPYSSNVLKQGMGRPDNTQDNEDISKAEAMVATSSFHDQLQNIYNNMVNSVLDASSNENDKLKILAYVVAGFGSFMELTNEMVQSHYRLLNPEATGNRWEIEAITWNTGYVQKFTEQVKNTIDGFIGAFQRNELSKELLLFKIETYLKGQSYRVGLYAEEIPAKIALAVQLDKIGKTGIEYVKPITMGDDKVCEMCFEAASAGMVMTLNQFFATYPLHVNGRCYPEAVTDYDPHQKRITFVGKDNAN